jgi:hypothetical protein
VRKIIDTIIATRCLMDKHALLFSDRDLTRSLNTWACNPH